MSLTKDNVNKFFKISKLENNSEIDEENIKLETKSLVDEENSDNDNDNNSNLETLPEEDDNNNDNDNDNDNSKLETLSEEDENEDTSDNDSKLEEDNLSKKQLEIDRNIEDLAEDITKINERQENKKKQIELLLQMFQILKYDMETVSELTNITIQRDTLLQKDNKENLMDLIPEMKLVYKSAYLNCLHDNSIYKQKFPAINLLRQVLKCHHLSLTPKIVSNGYEKVTGKKRVNRIFIIQKQMF